MLAENEYSETSPRLNRDGSPHVADERVRVADNRLVQTKRQNNLRAVHRFYFGRLLRHLVLLEGTQLGEDSGSPYILTLPL